MFLDKVKAFFVSDKQKGDSNFIPISVANSINPYISQAGYYKDIVYACIGLRSDAVSGKSFIVKNTRSREEIENDITMLLNTRKLKAISAFLDLTGSAFIYVEKGITGRVMQLEVLNTNSVTIHYKSDDTVSHYQYNHGQVSKIFMPEEIIAINEFNPLGGYRKMIKGIGVVEATKDLLTLDSGSLDYSNAFFRNGAQVGSILTTDSDINEEQARRLMAMFEQRHKGANNANKPALLTGGIKLEKSNFSQKDTDFVKQREMIREDVLMAFRVPEAMLGKLDSANNASSKEIEKIFSKNFTEPRLSLIEEEINLFFADSGFYIEFINILPTDNEQINKDYADGLITLNEARSKKGEPTIEGGDRFIGTEENVVVLQKTLIKDEVKPLESFIKSKKITKEMSEELEKAGLKKYKAEEKRFINYDNVYRRHFKSIFNRQQKQYISDFRKANSDKKQVEIEYNIPEFTSSEYFGLYFELLSPSEKQLVRQEGQLALRDIGSPENFDFRDELVEEFFDSNIERYSGTIDTETFRQIQNVVKKAEMDGLGVDATVNQLNNVFIDLKTTRLEKIVRTETTRALNFAQLRAWEQSNIVVDVVWYTAEDERVCPNCAPLHNKKVGLGRTFFKLGDIAPGGLKLNYEDIFSPPLHPNCRCTLLAIINNTN